MPYHSTPKFLMPRAIIRPGNWGAVVRRTGEEHPEWTREQILERIRKEAYEHLPSRMECAYVIDELEEAIYYRDQKNNGARLYKVELISPDAPTHVADWKGTGPYDSEEWAHRYWRGDVIPHSETTLKLRERLVQSPLRVLRRVPH